MRFRFVFHEGCCNFAIIIGIMKSKNDKFSWAARGRSFRYAAKGIAGLFREEHNARIHAVAAVVAVGLGCWLDLSAGEWCAVVMCIGAVIAAEALNSAVEALADRITTDRDPLIGKAKDFAAAAVLITAIAAAVVGCIIFLPKLLNLI